MISGNARINLIRYSLLTILLIAAEPALALRCGGKLVNEGTVQSKVLRFCGKPTAVQIRSVYRAGFPRIQLRHSATRNSRFLHERELLFADRATLEVVVEEWTYNFGPHRLMRLIRFENGIVTGIRQLGYGYHGE